MANTNTPTTDERRQERDHGRMLAVWGSAYAVVGFAGVYAAQYVGNPWRLLLKVLGFMLAAGGSLCLLWFLGLAILSALENVKNPKPVERAFVALGILVASLALYLLAHA